MIQLFNLKVHNHLRHLPCVSEIESIGDSLFQTTDSDDQPGLSVEYRLFPSMIDREFHRGDNGQWIAPLRFKERRRRLPDNRQQAAKRARILDISLKKNPVKCQHATTFIQQRDRTTNCEIGPVTNQIYEIWTCKIYVI